MQMLSLPHLDYKKKNVQWLKGATFNSVGYHLVPEPGADRSNHHWTHGCFWTSRQFSTGYLNNRLMPSKADSAIDWIAGNAETRENQSLHQGEICQQVWLTCCRYKKQSKLPTWNGASAPGISSTSVWKNNNNNESENNSSQTIN